MNSGKGGRKRRRREGGTCSYNGPEKRRSLEEEEEERERIEAIEKKQRKELEQKNQRPRVRRTAAEEFKDDSDLRYGEETNRRKSSFLFEKTGLELGTDSEDEGTMTMDSLLISEKESLKREKMVNNATDSSKLKNEEKEDKIMNTINNLTPNIGKSKTNMSLASQDSKGKQDIPPPNLQNLKKAKAPITFNKNQNNDLYRKGQQETKQSEAIKCDQNFADENWDDDEDDLDKKVTESSSSSMRGEGKEETFTGKKKISEVTLDHLAGVQTDQNFVDDDWDA